MLRDAKYEKVCVCCLKAYEKRESLQIKAGILLQSDFISTHLMHRLVMSHMGLIEIKPTQSVSTECLPCSISYRRFKGEQTPINNNILGKLGQNFISDYL
ncbi:hypothetical protein XENORESO_013691 [Xenotaenia resolanae]|uniref:Uncharacterized protein n=1 Tax=Xenotaenia resolanae TaxID=208358 RepID=A0ABV0VVM9_9TELE